MKRIFFLILLAVMSTGTEGCDRYKYVANCNDKLVGRW